MRLPHGNFLGLRKESDGWFCFEDVAVTTEVTTKVSRFHFHVVVVSVFAYLFFGFGEECRVWDRKRNDEKSTIYSTKKIQNLKKKRKMYYIPFIISSLVT